MSNTRELDRYDKDIIKFLSKDGRLTVTELAIKTGLSKTPCQVRMKRLVRDGFIIGFRAIINHNLLDAGHIAFAEVKLRDTTKKALDAFNLAVQGIHEVEQCHMIAGAFDYLLMVRTKDINAYRHILGERISALPHVASSSTYVAMEAVKEVGHSELNF
jgi:Lrp/AsnC family leucine-responsive transcriptional regulator